MAWYTRVQPKNSKHCHQLSDKENHLNKRTILGIGVNDSDYQISNVVEGKKIICPFYRVWVNMIHRCYSHKYTGLNPSYIGCTVTPEWHSFMTFKSWMETQDWEGMHLDKDLLFVGNKIYSADNCLFLSGQVNRFILENPSSRGLLPIGVSFHHDGIRYRASVKNLGKGSKHLGVFTNVESAHLIYLKAKSELAFVLAAAQTDTRVSNAIINRYKTT